MTLDIVNRAYNLNRDEFNGILGNEVPQNLALQYKPIFELESYSSTKNMSSLSNQFRGAIAGSILGYWIGLHYASTPHSAQYLTFGAGLDWSWLNSSDLSNPSASPLSKRYISILTQLFTVGLEGTEQKTLEHVHHHTPNNNDSMVPLETMLRVLDNLMDQKSDFGFNQNKITGHRGTKRPDVPFKGDTQSSKPINDGENEACWLGANTINSSIEAIFILFPILLLYHDHRVRQQHVVEQWLLPVQPPRAWLSEFEIVGRTVSHMMQSDSTIQQRNALLGHQIQSDTRLDPNIRISCEAVLRSFGSYELALLSLLCFPQTPDIQWHLLPFITGITGGVVGSTCGFTGLPLMWRIFMNNHQQYLSQKFCPSHLDWSARLQAVWSGCEVRYAPMRTIPYPTTTISRMMS